MHIVTYQTRAERKGSLPNKDSNISRFAFPLLCLGVARTGHHRPGLPPCAPAAGRGPFRWSRVRAGPGRALSGSKAGTVQQVAAENRMSLSRPAARRARCGAAGSARSAAAPSAGMRARPGSRGGAQSPSPRPQAFPVLARAGLRPPSLLGSATCTACLSVLCVLRPGLCALPWTPGS